MYPPSEETDKEMEAWMAERVEGYEGRAQDGVFKNEKGKRASPTTTHKHTHIHSFRVLCKV